MLLFPKLQPQATEKATQTSHQPIHAATMAPKDHCRHQKRRHKYQTRKPSASTNPPMLLLPQGKTTLKWR